MLKQKAVEDYSLEIDYEKKSVTSSIWKFGAKAQWQGPRRGCQLLQKKSEHPHEKEEENRFDFKKEC